MLQAHHASSHRLFPCEVCFSSHSAFLVRDLRCSRPGRLSNSLSVPACCRRPLFSTPAVLASCAKSLNPGGSEVLSVAAPALPGGSERPSDSRWRRITSTFADTSLAVGVSSVSYAPTIQQQWIDKNIPGCGRTWNSQRSKPFEIISLIALFHVRSHCISSARSRPHL